MSGKGWIGVDLDGTLAHYEGWDGGKIGKPVPLMVARVKAWLEVDIEVRIFTARISDPDRREQARIVAAIDVWCLKHIGRTLPVTNVKDFSCVELWDDRAIRVEKNTGRAIGIEEFPERDREAYNLLSGAAPSPQSAGAESRAGSEGAGGGAVPVRRRGRQG